MADAPQSQPDSLRALRAPSLTPQPSSVRKPSANPASSRSGPRVDQWVADRYDVDVLHAAIALRDHEEEWQELAACASQTNPFYEPWFTRAALEHGARDVIAVAIWARGTDGQRTLRRLDGLFCLEALRIAPGFEYLRTWQHPFAYLGAPLVRAGAEAEVVQAFLDWLPRFGRLPLVRLDLLPAEGALHHALVHALWERRWPSFLADASTRAFFRPAVTAEAFLESALRSKKRKELRRQLQRLSEQGRLEFTEVGEGAGEDLSRWVDEFLALEAAGWKGRAGVAVARTVGDTRLFREVVRHAALRDRLMLLALRLDGRPIAMKLNLLGGGGSFAVKIAYDESLARFSPGVQLELDNIHRLHQRTDVGWMDSCASPNRAMINQLWPERRELHSLMFCADRPLPSAVIAALPALRWAKRWLVPRRPALD